MMHKAPPTPAPVASPPLRRVRYTSFFYLHKASLIWRVCMLTLPLDLTLLLTRLKLNSAAFASLSYLLLALTLALIARDWALDHTALLRARLERMRKTLRKYSWAGALLFFAVAMLELGVKLRAQGAAFDGLIPIAVAAVALIVIAAQAFRAIRAQVRERIEHQVKLATDKIYWVEHTNLQIFLVAVAPIAGARLLSITSMLAHQSPTSPAWGGLPWCLLAALLLIAAQPQREHFVVQCKRCGFWTSRALKGLRLCPKCDMQAFQTIAAEEEQE